MDITFLEVVKTWGPFGLVLFAVLTGQLVPRPYYKKLEEENKLLREAQALDRRRGDEAEDAGRVTSQLIGAISDLAAENRGQRGKAAPPTRPPPGGLTWDDLS